MKFSSIEEIQMFLIDCDVNINEVSSANDLTFTPSQELIETFIKRRRNSSKSLKDFRKSQVTKEQWRHKKYDMMKGIKAFHSSTKGKKFHRNLGRFISTRVPLTKSNMMSIRKSDESYFLELSEVFKSLSSLKTHAWIQLDNYMTLSDYVDYEIFLEKLMEVTSEFESQLLKLDPMIKSESLDFLIACISPNSLIDSFLSEGQDFNKLKEQFEKYFSNAETAEFPFIESLQSALNSSN